jgi:CPA2 family monovalent cation:H+ antiporter-2/glutathione-regulated potassium-efflux system protein KefB
MLVTLTVLLAVTVFMIPLSRRVGFGSILGYLVGGALIGPAGFRLVTGVDEIKAISQLGVVMLLFLIGLELRPQRLWVMRRAVFGLGSAQLVVTGLGLAALAHVGGIPWVGAIVFGLGGAMSSTAIVLPLLAERDLLGSGAGRDIFAVLLFQDLAFIPLIALVPFLAGDSTLVAGAFPWGQLLRVAAAIAAILLGGRFLVRPAFRAIGGARTPEVFTALALLTVVGTAALANAVGLSMSLGAFLAGVLLSDSEFRHEIQADIEPFEGLLLGFFFMSVGMSANLGLAIAEPGVIAGGVAALVLGKAVLGVALGRASGQSWAKATRFGLALPQGSEFSFVLFGAAVAHGVLPQDAADRATLVIALSMVATPILFALSERFLVPRLIINKIPQYDSIVADGSPVIICGFGRIGQIVGRILRMHGIKFTALEQDIGQVETVRKFGTKIYYGNPNRPDLLRAAGAETAKVLVVALEDMEESLRVAEIAHRTFPKLKIVAPVRNRRHAHLMLNLGIDGIVRETFHSSLRLTEMVLTSLGIPGDQAERAVRLFQDYDERLLLQTLAFHDDERQLIQSSQQATEELQDLFESDVVEQAQRPAAE